MSDRFVIRSGAWKADWHALDLTRQAGGEWSYTLCRLMLKGVEQAPMDTTAATCPLCVALLRQSEAPGA
jgi:hypothetical protein